MQLRLFTPILLSEILKIDNKADPYMDDRSRLICHAQWYLDELVDPHNNLVLCALYPQDKSANASGLRRTFKEHNTMATPNPIDKPIGTAPLLKALMADYAATGMPPAYVSKDEDK